MWELVLFIFVSDCDNAQIPDAILKYFDTQTYVITKFTRPIAGEVTLNDINKINHYRIPYT